jgi:Transglycosylase-like domain
MSERTDHPPSTEASARPSVVRRAVIGGAAGVALLVGPVALANVIVPKDDANADRVEAAADSGTSLVNLRRQSDALDLARAGALQSLRTTTTAPPTTTTTAPPTTTTTAPPTTTTTAPPTTTTTAPPTTEPPPPDTGGGLGDPGDYATWDALADCESGGNWSINTGNGYYGGLQFSLSSWQAVGGPPGLPSDYSRETQIQMGQRLQARSGWGAWPACAAELGYI